MILCLRRGSFWLIDDTRVGNDNTLHYEFGTYILVIIMVLCDVKWVISGSIMAYLRAWRSVRMPRKMRSLWDKLPHCLWQVYVGRRTVDTLKRKNGLFYRFVFFVFELVFNE